MIISHKQVDNKVKLLSHDVLRHSNTHKIKKMLVPC